MLVCLMRTIPVSLTELKTNEQHMSSDPRMHNHKDAREWVSVLAKYREPNTLRSSFELGVSVVPFVVLWAMACWMASFSYTAAFAIALFNGAFLLRLFCIQHDCGHGSFFNNRTLSDWVGRALGVVTLTPYDVWRRTHSIHHSHAGDLDHRGIGDVMTLTVDEYNAASKWDRLKYRAYRHPIVMFGVGPAYVFFLHNRLPMGAMKDGIKPWASALLTNLGVAVLYGLMIWAVGWKVFVLIQIPTVIVAASIGVWMFYVQHQFDETHWSRTGEWDREDAALRGSSYYALPAPLMWVTGNIGVHHVHHLSSRIPFYRLPRILKDHPELKSVGRLTFWKSLKCVRLALWCETTERLVSFRAARGALA